MLGKLTEQQMDELLKKQVIGRLGCSANGIPYIVPINYVYRDNTIFAHSGEGKKIDMMRKNPSVCFQVDHIESLFRWQSVVAWGRFEEITDLDEKQEAMQGLIHRIMPMIDTPAGHPSHGITGKESDIGTKIDLIVYKIVLSKITGRFETDL